MKNVGYNNLDDVFVTVSVPALGLRQSSYFGDIVALECDEDDSDVENYGVDVEGPNKDRRCNEDDEDTIVGRLYLEVPFGVQAGAYDVEVVVENDDATSEMTRQITIVNDFTDEVIVGSTRKSVAVGQEAEFNLLIVNPTDKVKVYTVMSESSGGLSSSVETTAVAVPAGSSANVRVVASAQEAGEYQFNARVLSGNTVVESVPLAVSVTEGKSSVTDPVVILTVILAIVFIVLLIVLIVLIAKKPEKSEEFGESYY